MTNTKKSPSYTLFLKVLWARSFYIHTSSMNLLVSEVTLASSFEMNLDYYHQVALSHYPTEELQNLVIGSLDFYYEEVRIAESRITVEDVISVLQYGDEELRLFLRDYPYISLATIDACVLHHYRQH